MIVVPSGTVIVTYLPGNVSELKPGAGTFVPGAAEQAHCMVGRDVARRRI
jgi:hypothetical protein